MFVIITIRHEKTRQLMNIHTTIIHNTHNNDNNNSNDND